jgi:hypothetical protein
LLLFLHIVGAMGLFAAIALEWGSLVGLRRAASGAAVEASARLLGTIRIVGGPAMLVTLATGIYLGATRWGHQLWIGVSVLGLIVNAALAGAVTGRRAAAILASLPSGDGPLAESLVRRLHDPTLRLSAWLKTAIALGIVFEMSVKPGPVGALAAMGVALALGGVLAATTRSGDRAPSLGTEPIES